MKHGLNTDFSVAERRRKLASYEVAGWNEQINSVPEGTVELIGNFPPSLQDVSFLNRKPGTLCRANFQLSFQDEVLGKEKSLARIEKSFIKFV